MKMKKILLGLVFVTLALPSFVGASTLYSQSINLSPGWNVVSTPRVLSSHSFSTAETSANFDIYVLDAAQPSQWATMAQEGQTEFSPLFGYFIDNKTEANQTLTFNYLASTTPNQQLFQRTLTTPGWYSFGVANPTYALPVGTAASADTNNPGKILNALSGLYDSAVDFTDSLFSINPDAVGVGSAWKAVVPSDINTLNDFRETKGYALHLTQVNGIYDGFQNSNTPSPVITSFTASSSSIANGASSTLSWLVTGATALSIDQGVGTVTGNSVSVSPTATETYTLTATNTGGSVTSTATVHVSTFSTSIQNATAIGSQNLAVNVNGQPLGGFTTNLTGEAITAQSVKIHFTTTNNAIGPIQNVSLVDQNGHTIAGPYTATCDNAGTTAAACGTAQTVNFQGSVNFPVGASTYTLQGEIPSGTTSGVTIQASTNPSIDWTNITGNTTGDNIIIAVGNFSMSTMTVKTASLSVANGSTPTSQTVVAGGSNIQFATIQLDASQSGENVRLASLPLELTLSTYATSTDLSNCQLYNGTTVLNTASRVVNSSNISSSAVSGTTVNPIGFNFDNSLTVPKGTVLTLSLQCNLAPSAGSGQSYIWSASPTAGNYSVSGANSGASVTGPALTLPGANGGPTMMVLGDATLAAYTDNTSPTYNVVANGTTGVTLGIIRLHATNGSIVLQSLGLQLNTSLASTSDLSNVNVYAGNNVQTTSGTAIAPNTLLGSLNFSGTSGVATTTFNSATNGVMLPANTNATFVVKGDIATVGSNPNVAAGSGHIIKVNYLNAQGVGSGTGKTVYGGTLSDSGVSGVLIYRSFPSFTQSSSAVMTSGTISNLLSLAVAANGSGPVTLNQLVFSVSTTTATYSTPTFTGPNGNVGTVSLNAAGTLLTVVFNSSSNTADAVISAGSSKTYNLGGLIALTGGSNSTGSVSIALKGDSALPVFTGNLGGLAATSTMGNSHSIWSPMSTTTVVGTTGLNDWTNSYGDQAAGSCYQQAGLGADCFAVTIAK